MKLKNVCILILAIIVISCANPQPPPGGPKDYTRPDVVESYPKNSTLNFSDKKITLKFNKYMNKSEVIENVFISTAIVFKNSFVFSLGGKSSFIVLNKN